MGDASVRENRANSLVDYVRETLEQVNETRIRVALILFAIEGMGDPKIEEALIDYQKRVAENRAYEDVVDVEELRKRFVG